MTIDLSFSRVIAHMLCPDRPVGDGPVPNAVSDGDLVAACVRNKVPLLSLDTTVPDMGSFFEGEAFRSARAAEMVSFNEARSEYASMHDELERLGVRHVMLKSVGIAPSLTYRSDNLDVLVSQSQGPGARGVLLSLGYIELRNVEEPSKFLFRKFHRGRTVSAIHLHEFVGWGTGFMDDSQVLERSQLSADDPTVRIPSLEDGLLVTMAHAFYEDKEIKLGDLWKVVHLLRGQPLDWGAVYRQVALRGWRDGLNTCICLWAELERSLYGQHSFPEAVVARAREELPGYCQAYLAERFEGSPRFPFGLSFGFSKRHYYVKVYRDQMLGLGAKLRDVARHSWAGVARRLPYKAQRPFLVSLSGIDGSGKSVQAAALMSALRECDLRASTVWSRAASSPGTDRIISLAKRALPRPTGLDVTSDRREAKVARKSLWMRRPLLRWGWVCLVIIDLILRYWRQISWPLCRRRIVIADRYAYDALTELDAYTKEAEVSRSWPARLLLALTSRPHLAYLLKVSPHVALRRKPDELYTFMARQGARLEELATPWGLQVLDAESKQDVVSDRLVHDVLTAYYERWPTAGRLPEGSDAAIPDRRGG